MRLLLRMIQKVSTTPIPTNKLGYNDVLPNITVARYIDRIRQYGRLDKAVLNLTALYVLRLSTTMDIHVGNIHRLIGILLLLATKMDHDIHFDNRYFSRLMGITVLEVNDIERQVLAQMKFNLYPYPNGREQLLLK